MCCYTLKHIKMNTMLVCKHSYYIYIYNIYFEHTLTCHRTLQLHMLVLNLRTYICMCITVTLLSSCFPYVYFVFLHPRVHTCQPPSAQCFRAMCENNEIYSILFGVLVLSLFCMLRFNNIRSCRC